jgi:hypothetical protein
MATTGLASVDGSVPIGGLRIHPPPHELLAEEDILLEERNEADGEEKNHAWGVLL